MTVPDEKQDEFMRAALTEAYKAPLHKTNFRVGAIIVNNESLEIVSRGYTNELPGNTHAEECALNKLASRYDVDEDDLASVEELRSGPFSIFTTMVPCSRRLSGNKPCVERIIAQKDWLRSVYYGAGEPPKFISENSSLSKLPAVGILVVRVHGLEDEIIKTAEAGHQVDEYGHSEDRKDHGDD